MATKIGVDNLVYAPLLTDDGAADPTWGVVVEAIGVMSLNINPNASMETLFYDDGPGETASTLGQIEVEIQKNELTSQQIADLLGHNLDLNGAVVYGAADVPPWVAIGFRTLKSNGTYRYVWLYKGKFMEPEDNNETKGDTINFQAPSITGRFVKVNKSYKVGDTLATAKTVKPWKYEIDEEHTGADATVISNWFSAVQLPEEPTT